MNTINTKPIPEQFIANKEQRLQEKAVRKSKERCPLINSVGYDDESIDLCMLSEKPSGRISPCLLISGATCDIWDDIKQENIDYEWSQVRDKY